MKLAVAPVRVAASADDEMLVLLRRIADGIDALRSDLVKRRSVLTKSDLAALQKLFPAIENAGGCASVWTARETVACAIKDGGDLLAALEPIDDGTAKRLGRLLRRATDARVSGLRLERCGDARDGAVWTLKRV